MKTKVYNLKNIDCAHCAAIMEEKIKQLDEVENASLVFATKKLYITAKKPDNLKDKINEICESIDIGAGIDENANEEKDGLKHDIKKVIIGSVIFLLGETAEHISLTSSTPLPLILFICAYIILGGEVLLKAAKNIAHGIIFDENFLMSIATLGAFAIGQYGEGVGVMLFYGIGEIAEHLAVEKSRSAVNEAIDMRSQTVLMCIGDDVIETAAENASVGDVVLVRPGDRIPLDGKIVFGSSTLDTSSITGEFLPVSVVEGDEVISGYINKSGNLKISVTKVLGESMVSKILSLVEDAVASKPKIDNFITRFAKIYTPIVVAIAAFTAFIIPLFTNAEFSKMLYTALSFLVISCPCALVLSVPLAFFCGIGAASKKGILFKGGIALEAAAKVKNIVFDKTGTLTSGVFSVNEIKAFEENSEEEIISLMASCEAYSTHPIAQSILNYAAENNISYSNADNVEEFAGLGIKAKINGKDFLLGGKRIMTENGVSINTSCERYTVLISADKKLLGGACICDTLKSDTEKGVNTLKKSEKKVFMFTGDSKENAEIVSEKLKLDGYYAELLPSDKLESLKNTRHTGCTMFVGDGINDAPVLAAADIGVAMGSGSDAAVEAADVVLMKSNISSVTDIINLGKKTVGISRQNVVFALGVKIAVMILGITGIFSSMWLAVASDTGVALACILNSVRILKSK